MTIYRIHGHVLLEASINSVVGNFKPFEFSCLDLTRVLRIKKIFKPPRKTLKRDWNEKSSLSIFFFKFIPSLKSTRVFKYHIKILFFIGNKYQVNSIHIFKLV